MSVWTIALLAANTVVIAALFGSAISRYSEMRRQARFDNDEYGLDPYLYDDDCLNDMAYEENDK